MPIPMSPLLSPPTIHNRPLLAWKATSQPPVVKVVMEGLVSAAMPRPSDPLLSLPMTQRVRSAAWKATCHPPPGVAVMEGLVPGAIPRPICPLLSLPTIHKEPSDPWNAASHPPPARPTMVGLVPGAMPRPIRPLLSEPITQRESSDPWKAASHPPPERRATAGLVWEGQARIHVALGVFAGCPQRPADGPMFPTHSGRRHLPGEALRDLLGPVLLRTLVQRRCYYLCLGSNSHNRRLLVSAPCSLRHLCRRLAVQRHSA